MLLTGLWLVFCGAAVLLLYLVLGGIADFLRRKK